MIKKALYISTSALALVCWSNVVRSADIFSDDSESVAHSSRRIPQTAISSIQEQPHTILHLGVKALREKRYKDAFKHFSDAAKLNHRLSQTIIKRWSELNKK